MTTFKQWKDNYLNIINRASKRLGYDASDLNPWFYTVYDHLHKTNANSLREFKQQIKQGKNNNA